MSKNPNILLVVPETVDIACANHMESVISLLESENLDFLFTGIADYNHTSPSYSDKYFHMKDIPLYSDKVNVLPLCATMDTVRCVSYIARKMDNIPLSLFFYPSDKWAGLVSWLRFQMEAEEDLDWHQYVNLSLLDHVDEIIKLLHGAPQ